MKQMTNFSCFLAIIRNNNVFNSVYVIIKKRCVDFCSCVSSLSGRNSCHPSSVRCNKHTRTTLKIIIAIISKTMQYFFNYTYEVGLLSKHIYKPLSIRSFWADRRPYTLIPLFTA